ncbi:hypothetical protein [Parasulfitobacter algicola]|uniref:Lipoprotein n=1 Tax=Parasulfitobacter algicola TaxID=2614809 RepID=A0ABX2IUL8_9RHOB|nr:hypothetical protein [Sulfitobacter algicola]NSX56596.1 hypothetical protein [Sulfitobacter algicola]
MNKTILKKLILSIALLISACSPYHIEEVQRDYGGDTPDGIIFTAIGYTFSVSGSDLGSDSLAVAQGALKKYCTRRGKKLVLTPPNEQAGWPSYSLNFPSQKQNTWVIEGQCV